MKKLAKFAYLAYLCGAAGYLLNPLSITWMRAVGGALMLVLIWAETRPAPRRTCIRPTFGGTIRETWRTYSRCRIEHITMSEYSEDVARSLLTGRGVPFRADATVRSGFEAWRCRTHSPHTVSVTRLEAGHRWEGFALHGVPTGAQVTKVTDILATAAQMADTDLDSCGAVIGTAARYAGLDVLFASATRPSSSGSVRALEWNGGGFEHTLVIAGDELAYCALRAAAGGGRHVNAVTALYAEPSRT